MGCIIAVGPNEVLLTTGGCCGQGKMKAVVGGWIFADWNTDVYRMSLEIMTLDLSCRNAETVQGVQLSVTGVAQCKIMNGPEMLAIAAEQFFGRTVSEIAEAITPTVEGHLRAILGTLTVEEVYKDREKFALLVREVAAPDVGRMGIEILSFTIKDVYDDVQYLASLGKAQTAIVKRDADIGIAEANRDAGIREAECERKAMDVKYSTDTRIEDNARLFKLQKAQFDQEVNTAKADAELAFDLQAAKVQQKIRNEEVQIKAVERRKQIEVEQQEILRNEQSLLANIRLPAEAEAYRLQTVAEGYRTKTVEAAKADAERIRMVGAAEASAIADVGKADAERMLAKAQVYKQYGDAAIEAMALEALPKIAAEVSAPLARTDEIVLVGDSGATGEVARLAGGLPPAIKTLTGLDVTQVLKRLHSLSGGWFGLLRLRAIVGGWGFATWRTRVGRMSLEVMTMELMCEDAETLQGVQLTVSGVVQCKIINGPKLLTTAGEQFFGKTVPEIIRALSLTLEGHLRAILSK